MKNQEINIRWSIHMCQKVLNDKQNGISMTVGYMTTIKKGKKTANKMHKTIFDALRHVDKEKTIV